jgi:hypothetical protein
VTLAAVPPASYIAVFACAADVYLAWTYATLEAMRTYLRDSDGRLSKAERFSLCTTYLHGMAAMLWSRRGAAPTLMRMRAAPSEAHASRA